jgi:hypothetical protein
MPNRRISCTCSALPTDQAGDHIAVAAEILGGRMQHHIGAELDRAGEVGGGIGVVDNHRRTGLMGDLGDGLDIDQPHVRIGRRFEIDDPRLAADHRDQVVRIGHVHMGDRDAEFRQAMAHVGEGAAVERLVDDDLVTRGQQRPQGRGDRAHARRQRQPGFRAFQQCDARSSRSSVGLEMRE